MKPIGIRYLVSHHSAMYGLDEDFAGTLDVVNVLTDNVFWFDNDNLEWHKSIYSAKSTLQGIGEEYVEVERFDNGYINTDDLWDERAKNSLIRRYSEEFERNFNETQKQIEQ